MRPLDDPEFAPFLLKSEWAKRQLGVYNNKWNAFMEIPCGVFRLRVIASIGGGWDHVSVSLASRTPTWDEMEYVKRLLFKPGELAWQLHLPPDDHINVHPYTLHLWRKHGFKMPLPPKVFV